MSWKPFWLAFAHNGYHGCGRLGKKNFTTAPKYIFSFMKNHGYPTSGFVGIPFIIICLSIWCWSPAGFSAHAFVVPTLSEKGDLEEEPFSDLNLRFSNRPLTPPQDLVEKIFPLDGISVARPIVAPAPQAVIFEDDHRRRVAVLSQNTDGSLTLYLLEPLPLDPKLKTLVQCATSRRCQSDRTPLTGGLGCVALCIKELLEATALHS